MSARPPTPLAVGAYRPAPSAVDRTGKGGPTGHESRVTNRGRFKTRRARAADAETIQRIITHFAEQGLLLPRTLEEVQGHLPHFLVYEVEGAVIGCVALETYGADLAEVRSLAVAPGYEGHGLGARLLRFALVVARRRKIARVFAVTHAPEFFERQGFAAARRQSIPEKVERDCRTCPKERTCKLVAVVTQVMPERAVLPALEAPASPA